MKIARNSKSFPLTCTLPNVSFSLSLSLITYLWFISFRFVRSVLFFYGNEFVHFYFALSAVTAADCLFLWPRRALSVLPSLPNPESRNLRPKNLNLKPHPAQPLDDHFLRHSVDETQLRSSKILRTSLEKFWEEEMDGGCLALDDSTRRENRINQQA